MSTKIEIRSVRPLSHELFRRSRLRDLAVIGAVPLVLVAVFALPWPVRRSFVFAYTDPSVLTAYTAPFVHLDVSHLLVNVVGFAVVVPTAYALAVLSDTRRRFWIAFVTFVVVFPPVLSYLNLAIVRPTVGFGFSGVLLAFVGYFPVALADYAAENFDVGPREAVSPTLFFLGLALIAILSVRSVVPANRTVLLGTALLVVATLLSASLYLLTNVDQDRSAVDFRGVVGLSGYFELFLVAGALFVGMQFVAFPGDPIVGNGVVNLYVHLLGYALGFIATYVTIQVGEVLPGTATSV